jgi:membrane protein implicated in regulation of membrane protease activity
MDWLNNVVFWHWWILAGVLLILELTSPMFFFLWLGFAAVAVGLLLLAFAQPAWTAVHRPDLHAGSPDRERRGQDRR